jgi:hypothetical protein
LTFKATLSLVPLDMRIGKFNNLLGNWLGEEFKVDVQQDNMASSKLLRVRDKIHWHTSLVRGFYIKFAPEDLFGTWYDFQYEKMAIGVTANGKGANEGMENSNESARTHKGDGEVLNSANYRSAGSLGEYRRGQ